MMNAFEQHGIGHLSVSQANLFAAAPALYVMERLLGHRGGVGISAHRGTAAEHGIERGLFSPDMPVSECQDAALKEFDRLTALCAGANRDKEREAIPGIVETALAELRQYGAPSRPEGGRQHKIECRLDGVPVPVIGYLDFVFGQSGTIVDLKTQLALSSKIKEEHARQGALYQHAHGNYEMRFAYTTPKKIGVYVLENGRQHLEALRQIFLRMERFLSVSKDPKELAGIVCPDYSSFYWSDPATRAKGLQVFGF